MIYAGHRHDDDGDMVAAIYRAMLAAAPPVDGWQPIETAPRDGGAFMVWWPHWFHFPLTAYFKDFRLRLSDSTQPAEPWEMGTDFGPTHWMPLPQPPNNERTG
jgi:hypothetical protein